jgi:Ca-activated chloride channel family protein
MAAVAVVAVLASPVLLADAQRPASGSGQPKSTFKTGVDLVSVTAVVRDSKGRPVQNLSREDFQVFERGKPRRIVDFKSSDQGPVSLAILFDVSGSMRIGAQMEAGRRAVEHVLSWVEPRADEFSLFSFDRGLRQETPFTNDPAVVRSALQGLAAVGQTSLYDAIADTARQLAHRPSPRRAVVVITDGIDTSSEMTPSEVSGIASSIDVPVYVIAVLSPLDHPGTRSSVVEAEGSPVATHLANLAEWTGGTLHMVSTPAHASQAARELMVELRHQYLLAFESAKEAGWYELDVKTRRRELTVRARSGYFAGQSTQG